MTNDRRDRAFEQRIRRAADAHGLAVCKSRKRLPDINDLGGYTLLDRAGNYVVAGGRFELDLDDLAELLEVEHR